MLKPIKLSEGTPGERIAARRRMTSRPGHDDYLREELTRCCDFLANNPAVRDALGPDLDVGVGFDGQRMAFVFTVMQAQ